MLKDISRVHKKLNGFEIILIDPSLTLYFFTNYSNEVHGFVAAIQRRAKDALFWPIVVTNTTQEEIHEERMLKTFTPLSNISSGRQPTPSKGLAEDTLLIDFAIRAGKVTG